MAPRHVAVLTVCGLTAAAVASAQPPSLAEVAEREKTRRAAIEEKSRVFTNADLRGGRRLTTRTSPVQRLEPSPSTDSVNETTDDATPERDETYWRDRVAAARAAHRRAALMAEALQNRIDGLWAQFTARDDPFQRAQIEQDRHEALDELEATRAEIDRLEKQIEAIHEEARRAGVPAGWLRDRETR